MYHKGCVDLDINLSTAKEWYDKGSENNHSNSQYEAYALHKLGVTATGAKDASNTDTSNLGDFSDQGTANVDAQGHEDL